MSEAETIQSIPSDSLITVTGGDGDGDAGACFDQVAGWGAAGLAGGALTGPWGAAGGLVAGAGGAYLTTPACGVDGKAPITMLRDFTMNSGRGNTNFNYQGEQTP